MSKIISNLLVRNLIQKVHKSLSPLERLSALSTYQHPAHSLSQYPPVHPFAALHAFTNLHTLYKIMFQITLPLSQPNTLLYAIPTIYFLQTWSVTTPPMVGSTWPRVRSTLESDCLPTLFQGTVSSRYGLTARFLHCRRAYPMSRDWGCTSTYCRSFYVPILSMRPWGLYLHSHVRPFSWQFVSHDRLYLTRLIRTRRPHVC